MYERVFEKDGVQVSTAVPAQAVRLLSEGYHEVLDDKPAGYVGDAPKPDLSRVQPPQLRPDLPGRPPADERNNAPD